MSKHRRGRITVQHQPTGGERFMMKGVGAVHAVMGVSFVVAGVGMTAQLGLFGLPFLVGGAFFAVNGIRMLVSRNDVAHRVGYDVETDIEGRSIAGLMEDVDAMAEEDSPAAGSVEERLRTLLRLREQGLLSNEEYEQKRRDILADL